MGDVRAAPRFPPAAGGRRRRPNRRLGPGHREAEVGAPLTITAGAIAQIAVAPDGETFAVGGIDSTASLWDLRSRKRIGETFPIERATIPAVAFDRRGRLLITELGSAILWPVDVDTWRRFACDGGGRHDHAGGMGGPAPVAAVPARVRGGRLRCPKT